MVSGAWERNQKRLLRAYVWLAFAYLYIPILVVITFSFNNSRLNVRWHGFTLKWYPALLHDDKLIEAAKHSLTVAGVTTVVSTALGTALAIGLYRAGFRGRRLIDGLIYIPVIVPETVMGISLLALYAALKIPLGLVTIMFAHIAFATPFVTLVVRARLAGFDYRLIEAAQDLGAGEWEAFRRVTLPLITPGVLAGGLLAFTLSMDDFIVTFFTSGPGSTTLPLYIYGAVKFGVSPVINALSALMLLLTVAAIGLFWALVGRGKLPV